jgi:serine/threonine-protein kinase
VKPGNIFLVREHTGELLVKVMDFGLAAARPVAMPDSDGPAKASWVAGTPCYVAPEQAKGLAASPAADLYALGVTLYELMAGDPPFPDSPSQPVAELLRKHLSEPPVPLSRKVSNLPEGVEEFVATLLEKDPAKRPASADLARAQAQRLLKRLASDATAVKGVALPMSALSQAPRQATDRVLGPPPADTVSVEVVQEKKKGRGAIVAALLLLLLLGGLGIWKLGSSGEEKIVTPPPAPVKMAEVVKAPEPVKAAEPEPVKAVEPVKAPEPEPLAVPVKRPLKVTIRDPKVRVEETCGGDEVWKKSAHESLQTLQKYAYAAEQYDEWSKLEPQLEQRIQAANANNCEAVDTEITNLAVRYQSMRKH